MPIEFRCTSCGKLLRTQEGTEGKQAKCPQCGTVLDIPLASQPDLATTSPFVPPPREPNFGAPPVQQAGAFAPPPPDPGAFAPPPDSRNPYQSPGTYGRASGTVTRGFQPTRIDFGETLSRTWEIYKLNLGACIGGTLLVGILSLVVSGIVQAVFTPVFMNVEGAAFLVTWGLQQAVAQAISAFFYIGLILFLLRIARGEGVEFGALFSGGQYFVVGAVVQIITTLAMWVGFLLLIIPGVIAALMFSQSMYVVADQKAGIGDALTMSMQAMKGNKLTVFAIWVVAGVLGLLLTIVTCGIGLIFVAPYGALLMAVIYLGATGQKTVLDLAPAPSLPERGFGAQPG